MNRLQQLNVAAGNFFFRYRNGLFPLVFLFFMLTLRPQILFGRPHLDKTLVTAGFFVVAVGEAVRLSTIGFEYIERGGKQGQVYATTLVKKGVYGLTRNPMYVGNMLIAIGIIMVSGSPLAYLTVIPFFFFVYQAIIAAEENYLRGKFAVQYEAYCRQVPRFFPSFKGLKETFQDVRFNWRRPFKQDLSTIAWIVLVLVALPCWRSYFLRGWQSTRKLLYQTVWVEVFVLGLYVVLIVLKRQKSSLFYSLKSKAS